MVTVRVLGLRLGLALDGKMPLCVMDTHVVLQIRVISTPGQILHPSHRNPLSESDQA